MQGLGLVKNKGLGMLFAFYFYIPRLLSSQTPDGCRHFAKPVKRLHIISSIKDKNFLEQAE